MSDGDTWDCDKCTFVNSVDDLTCTMCYQVRSSTRALPYTWQWLAQVDWIPYDGPSNEQCEAAFQAGADKVNLSKGWFESKKGEYTVHFGRRPVAPAKGSKAKAAAPRRGAGAAAAAPVLHSDNDDDGDDPCDEGEDGDSSGPAAAAASAAVSSVAPATVAAYTQVNNHSRMVRKVRRLANDDMEMFVLLPPSAVPRGDKCSICSEEWWENEEVPEPAAAAVGDATAASPAKPAAPASASAAPAAAAAASSGAAPQTCLTLHPSDTWPDAALSCVKLVKCAPGHSFHRDCIAQWIKLKDKCPYCANKI